MNGPSFWRPDLVSKILFIVNSPEKTGREYKSHDQEQNLSEQDGGGGGGGGVGVGRLVK